MFGMLMSLHIASFMTGKVLGSLLTTAFGVTSANFTNLAPLVLVSHLRRLSIIYSSHSTALTLPNILQDSLCSYRQAAEDSNCSADSNSPTLSPLHDHYMDSARSGAVGVRHSQIPAAALAAVAA